MWAPPPYSTAFIFNVRWGNIVFFNKNVPWVPIIHYLSYLLCT